MSSSTLYEVRDIPLTLEVAAQRRRQLLADAGLKADHADYAVGVYDSDDRLVATASIDGDIIKGVAVDESVRSEQLTPRMVTALLEYAAAEGISNPKVFTKPEYAPVFRSLAFKEVGRGSRAVLLEHSPTALAEYRRYLAGLPLNGRVGCIVMHANPLTEGHLYLIRKAAQQCDTLVVIPVADTPESDFSYAERRDMLTRATADIPGVVIAEGSHYAVSRQSFPSYFIKEVGDLTDAHITLDLDIFCCQLAPALGAVVRFVGSEPLDPLTARYNELMHDILPQCGIEVVEIERMQSGESVVSASRVRKLLDEGRAAEAFPLVPPATVPYLLAHAAAKALRDELDTTPKPGLVDRDNNGAHTDMDYDMMARSIAALTPVFARIAQLASTREFPSMQILAQAAMEGEREMLEATGGVNTHRGALFSMGLAVAAAAWLIHTGETPSREAMRQVISRLADTLPRAKDTNGARVAARYGIPTALDYARNGFAEAFEIDLSDGPHKALLSLMSVIEDSNIYHRGGAEAAAMIKQLASALLADYSPEGMRQLDKTLTERHLSPGGAADMLALAMFVDSVTSENNSKLLIS